MCFLAFISKKNHTSRFLDSMTCMFSGCFWFYLSPPLRAHFFSIYWGWWADYKVSRKASEHMKSVLLRALSLVVLEIIETKWMFWGCWEKKPKGKMLSNKTRKENSRIRLIFSFVQWSPETFGIWVFLGVWR